MPTFLTLLPQQDDSQGFLPAIHIRLHVLTRWVWSLLDRGLQLWTGWDHLVCQWDQRQQRLLPVLEQSWLE